MTNNQHEDHERTGGLAGLGAGAVTGAALGTALIPIPIVGTFTGALVGGVLGSEVGKSVGGAILDAINPSSGTPSAGRPTNDELLAQLERLGQLRAQGLLSDDEFRAAKAKLLGM